MVKAIKLYVGNLPDSTKVDDLQTAFEKYGKVEECDVLRNYGFVHIADEDEAKVAMESLNNSEFNGSRITVEISHSKGQCYRCGRQGHLPKECPLNAKTFQRGNQDVPKESWWCQVEVQTAVDEKTVARKKWEETQSEEDRAVYVAKKKEAKRKVSQAKAKAFRGISKDSKRKGGWKSMARDTAQATKLYVGNLSESVNSSNLRPIFAKFGKVEQCDVLKNYGFVHMTNDDEAKLAVESLNQTEFEGNKITVEISKSKGQCYTCGRQGHWSKECMLNTDNRSGGGASSFMSRFGMRRPMDRFDGRSFALDRAYRTDRMRPYPDMYDRSSLGARSSSGGGGDDYYRSYSDYYGYSRQSPSSYMSSGNNYDRDYDYSAGYRSQDNNSSSNYNYMWSSSSSNTNPV